MVQVIRRVAHSYLEMAASGSPQLPMKFYPPEKPRGSFHHRYPTATDIGSLQPPDFDQNRAKERRPRRPSMPRETPGGRWIVRPGFIRREGRRLEARRAGSGSRATAGATPRGSSRKPIVGHRQAMIPGPKAGKRRIHENLNAEGIYQGILPGMLRYVFGREILFQPGLPLVATQARHEGSGRPEIWSGDIQQGKLQGRREVCPADRSNGH